MTGTSQIVTEMGRAGTMIVMMEEEIATGIVMMIEIVGIAMTTEEVSSCTYPNPPQSPLKCPAATLFCLVSAFPIQSFLTVFISYLISC